MGLWNFLFGSDNSEKTKTIIKEVHYHHHYDKDGNKVTTNSSERPRQNGSNNRPVDLGWLGQRKDED